MCIPLKVEKLFVNGDNTNMENLLWGITCWIKENIALIIAIIALCISLREMKHKEKFDKLSVRPWLEPSSVFSKNALTVAIKNVGFGPAILREFKIKIDDKIRTIDELKKYWNEMHSNIPFEEIEFTIVKPPCVIQVNKEYIIFSLIRVPDYKYTQNEINHFIDAIKKLSIWVTYESFLGEEFKRKLICAPKEL